MKSTPSLNGANGATSPVNNNQNGNEPKVVPVAELIRKAKGENSEEIKEPTTYPAPAPEPEAAQTPDVVPQTPKPTAQVPEAIAPATVAASLPLPARSRQEEIAFQVEKSRQLQLINAQLLGLTGKRDELKQFSYKVDENHDSRYGRLVIFDDNNREFTCKNHGLAALVVEFLKTLFEQKIDEKETELLAVSRS